MPTKIPTNELITNLQAVATDLGKTPTHSEYTEHELSEFSSTSFIRRFDKWNKAVKAAGLEPNLKRNIPTDELITNLQIVAADLGKTPTHSEYSEHELSKFSSTPFIRRFDKWNKAVKAAGLEPNSRQNIPTDKLITDLQVVADDLGKTPTHTEYAEHDLSKFSESPIIRRFGGWNNAIRAAGLEPVSWQSIPTDELITNLQVVADDLGRAPTRPEYTEHELSEFSRSPFDMRFGGWWGSVVAAGYRPFNHQPLQPATLDQYYRTAVDLPPKKSIPPLLFLFTGLPALIAQHLTPEWLQKKRDRYVIKVPPQHTTSGVPWLFRIPDEWENPHTGKTKPTHLPQTLDWVLDSYGNIPLSRDVLINQCLRVAQAADIDDNRVCRGHTKVGKSPVVRPSDLWATRGVNLARQKVDRTIIKRQLGIDHIEMKHTPEDFMLWVYVNEGFKHPDYDPPEVSRN